MKKKRTKRIMFLFIVTLLLLLLVKYSKNFNTSNPISHEINKTINDSKKSIEETEPTGEGSKDEEAKKATESNKSNASSENKNSNSTSNKNNSSSNNSNSGGSSSSNKGNGNGSNSGSNNSNSGNNSNNKPSHTHNWVNVTKTVNHPAETHQEDVYEDRQVKVKDAWDEQVKTGSTAVCRQCGYRTTDNNAMDMHCLEEGHSSTWETNYTTVHHDAVYETQRVKVGTKTVTDKAAWTETVVTGQKCSFCGETKTN